MDFLSSASITNAIGTVIALAATVVITKLLNNWIDDNRESTTRYTGAVIAAVWRTLRTVSLVVGELVVPVGVGLLIAGDVMSAEPLTRPAVASIAFNVSIGVVWFFVTVGRVLLAVAGRPSSRPRPSI